MKLNAKIVFLSPLVPEIIAGKVHREVIAGLVDYTGAYAGIVICRRQCRNPVCKKIASALVCLTSLVFIVTQ